MDYKRNKRYFSPTFKRNMTILSVLGIVLAVASYIVWWYILYYVIFEILIVIFVAMAIGAFAIRPKADYTQSQIDEQLTQFRTDTVEKLKLPSDFEDNSLLVWGYCPGTVEKTVGNSVQTDRVGVGVLYLRRSELYVRTRHFGLLAEEDSVEEYHLPYDGLQTAFSEDGKTLTFSSGDQSVILPIREKDFNLEQFLEKLDRRQK